MQVEVAAADAILRSFRDTDTMTVAELLVSQRDWGPTRAAKVVRSGLAIGQQDARVTPSSVSV